MTTRTIKIEKYFPASGSPVYQLIEETTINGQVIRLDPRNPTQAELDDANDQFAAAQASRITELEAEVADLQGQVDGLPPKPAPDTITPRQAKLALYGAGLLDAVEALISGADREIQIHYESATQWDRTDPVLNGLADQLGLSDEQLDDLFSQASQL